MKYEKHKILNITDKVLEGELKGIINSFERIPDYHSLQWVIGGSFATASMGRVILETPSGGVNVPNRLRQRDDESDIDIFALDAFTYRTLMGFFEKHINIFSDSYGVHSFYTTIDGTEVEIDLPPVNIVEPIGLDSMPLMSLSVPDLLDRIDFTICKCAMYYDIYEKSWYVTFHSDFPKHASYSELVVEKVRNPLRTAQRVCKYVSRGCMINPDQWAKIFGEWDSLPEDRRMEIFMSTINAQDKKMSVLF